MNMRVPVSFVLAVLGLQGQGQALTVGPNLALPGGFAGVTAAPLEYEATIYNLCKQSIWVSTVESYQYTCNSSSCPPTSFATRGWWEIPPYHERVFDFSRSRFIAGSLFFYIEDSSGFNVAPYSMVSVKSCVTNDALDLRANGAPSLCEKNATYFRPNDASIVISQCY